ncbi:Rad1-domain-containing protein [Macrolepiota fuliginosa MF-IS2]|uniref:Rad1-domain-containing protein n=1 Tax=Macrolepiota fuliginosa MF-IS2 TaxID=1400762 RepID=A0A9P5X7R2_9AGAR|nr:Rad1-domain-containing protein [Macrolepiota fuliginosa MF-IS2]
MSEEQPPILTASMHDLRHFATILRGINFNNVRATVTILHRGLLVKVEEARTITATAFIFSDIFDEYIYHSENQQNDNLMESSQGELLDNTMFEVSLNTLIDCLNIFGTGGPTSSGTGGSGGNKRWRKQGEGSDNESGEENEARGRGRRIEPISTTGSEKHTGMHMTYAGGGYPLTLLIAEDASGPTTTCEISTYEPEPQLDLDFDNDRMILKIILKSSWFRDALSELDPSCDKLTFVSNPPEMTNNPRNGKQRKGSATKPILRIKAGGNFGTTEMDYPNDRDVLESFECTRSISFSYRFTHIAKTLRALQSSTKTSLRIDDEGLLSLQFMMPSPKARGPEGEGAQAFIDFHCLPLDEDVV